MQRSQIELREIIGEGQFGDVHAGICKLKQNSKAGVKERAIPVAVKTCKADADLAMAEKFLEEACKFLFSTLHHSTAEYFSSPFQTCY